LALAVLPNYGKLVEDGELADVVLVVRGIDSPHTTRRWLR